LLHRKKQSRQDIRNGRKRNRETDRAENIDWRDKERDGKIKREKCRTEFSENNPSFIF
jgi:hypothetical protein